MAVIAAHGSVHPEGRYFQLVSDEGVLKVSAADLAGALRNVDVVIPFVCSGRRPAATPIASWERGALWKSNSTSRSRTALFKRTFGFETHLMV